MLQLNKKHKRMEVEGPGDEIPRGVVLLYALLVFSFIIYY